MSLFMVSSSAPYQAFKLIAADDAGAVRALSHFAIH